MTLVQAINAATIVSVAVGPIFVPSRSLGSSRTVPTSRTAVSVRKRIGQFAVLVALLGLIMLYRARQSAATRRPAAPTVKNHAHEAARGQRHVRRAARLRRHRPRAAGARGGVVLEQLAPARRGRATARRRRGEARARCSRQARTGSPQGADHADGAGTPLRAGPMGGRPWRGLE